MVRLFCSQMLLLLGNPVFSVISLYLDKRYISARKVFYSILFVAKSGYVKRLINACSSYVPKLLILNSYLKFSDWFRIHWFLNVIS